MIFTWINAYENICGTQRGHVNGFVSLQPVGVDHQLELLQGDRGELSVKPQGVVIRSLE